jgi:putative membrane protein
MPVSSALLACGDGGWWPGGGWGWLWGPIALLAWAAVIAAVGWYAVRRTRPGEGERSGVERAGDVLAERYARGELSTEEYQERRDQLR